MRAFTPGLETPFSGNSEQGPFKCTGEGKLYQRYLENKEKIKNQVQNYNEFKKKFLIIYIIKKICKLHVTDYVTKITCYIRLK